jgi:hypothetical protein
MIADRLSFAQKCLSKIRVELLVLRKPHKLGGIRQLVFSSHPATGVKTASHDAAAGNRVCAVG